MNVLKRLVGFFIAIFAFIYLSHQDMLPSTAQIQSFLDSLKDSGKPAQQEPEQSADHLAADNFSEEAVSPEESTNKYKPVKIQTYTVKVDNGKLVVEGKPTPYGKLHHAEGVVLAIQEGRSNKKSTLEVPFHKGEIYYEFPLSYTIGEVVLNLDEFYPGKKDDPEKVLGYAVYELTDGDPYLTPSYMVQSNDPNIVSLANSITIGKQTDSEKSKAIFYWVAQNVAYDAKLVDSPQPPLYSALQTFQTRLVLCTGYADLSAALHRAAGIQAKVVYGENHAWNEILLNGIWQTQDPTYASGFIDLNTKAFVRSYHPDYFSKSDKHKEGEYPW
ncbi:transglutaminase domain-containing protein [Neobacillus muris]|uniref:transglutaminase domain-containing protein n=1 Tax=Neobacillus muris TaxID=2941334 RepID=UPI00203FD9D0|nr:transglutaminase-like domain-containing protein [Neobacillus muris]